MAASNSSALVLPPTPSAGTNATDIRDIKEPIDFGPNLLWLWALLAALAVAALVYWLRKRKKKTVIDPVLLIPPHRRARERLRAARELLSDPYAFCSLVSNVTRDYLEERFDLKAPDRTTEEFLAEQRNSPLLLDAHKQLLEDFLTRCDLVKFARHEPTEGELRGLLDAALRLIDETQEVTPPPALPAVNAERPLPAGAAK